MQLCFVRFFCNYMQKIKLILKRMEYIFPLCIFMTQENIYNVNNFCLFNINVTKNFKYTSYLTMQTH